jgi:hypothetical protein
LISSNVHFQGSPLARGNLPPNQNKRFPLVPHMQTCSSLPLGKCGGTETPKQGKPRGFLCVGAPPAFPRGFHGIGYTIPHGWLSQGGRRSRTLPLYRRSQAWGSPAPVSVERPPSGKVSPAADQGRPEGDAPGPGEVRRAAPGLL